MQYQKKELFQGYEIKNWEFTPRLYKLFGAAAVLNILLLFGVVQANIFTTRGCDSPLVGSFCTVIDTLYLGKTLIDTNSDFVSEDYNKTKIEDAEITYIDVSGINNQPLNYPEGYFALANPESMMMQMPSPDVNGNFTMSSPNFNSFPTNSTAINPTLTTPNPTGANPLAQAQVTPTPNPDAVKGKMDDSLFGFENVTVNKSNPVPPPPTGSTARNRPPRGGKRGTNNAVKPPQPEKTPEVKTPDEQPPLNTEAVTAFRPNKKPLEDFAADIIAKREDKTKPLDLTKNFKVRMIGELDKNGKLIEAKTRYIKLKPEEQGDETMINIAKSAIEAINNGNMFFYLKELGIQKVDFTLLQDDEQIYAIISSAQVSEERARTMSSGMTGLLMIAKGTVKEDELKTLIDSAKAEQQAKNFVLKFEIKKPVAQQMITKKLEEAEAKKKAEEEKNGKPNSTATNNQNQKTAK